MNCTDKFLSLLLILIFISNKEKKDLNNALSINIKTWHNSQDRDLFQRSMRLMKLRSMNDRKYYHNHLPFEVLSLYLSLPPPQVSRRHVSNYPSIDEFNIKTSDIYVYSDFF